MKIGDKEIHPNDNNEILDESFGNRRPSDVEELKRMRNLLRLASENKDFVSKKN